jgi:AraC-like DNA-binding protein
VDAALALDMPEHCQVLAATPLLRALIVELDAIGQRQESADYTARVQQLIVDQLPRLPRQDVHLPWPKDPQLRTLCEALYAQPADPRDLPAWGAALGASARTLSRRFERELGISLRDWRTRLRLIRALEWLGAGRAVTDVALELGYASPSAFSHMFRQAMGCSPSDWRRGECG